MGDRPSTLISPAPCWTCRRRHVKCDGATPVCAKCERTGIECLGYQKPLRWVRGAAYRRKPEKKLLQGSTSIEQVPSQHQGQVIVRTNNVIEESRFFGSHQDEDVYSDITPKMSTLVNFVNYYNSFVADANNMMLPVHKESNRLLPVLSPDKLRATPRVVLNTILAVVSVHMASRNPNNPKFDYNALKTKVIAYERFRNMLQNATPEMGHVTVPCLTLMIALDIIEHGATRWRTHINGAYGLLNCDVIEPITQYVPSTWTNTFCLVHFAISSMSCSYLAIPSVTKPICYRHFAEQLFDLKVRSKKIFDPVPKELMMILWDVATIAKRHQTENDIIEGDDLQEALRILDAVVSFDAFQWVQDLQRESKRSQIEGVDTEGWLTITAAWQNTVIILVLRHLFFGRKCQHSTTGSSITSIREKGNSPRVVPEYSSAHPPMSLGGFWPSSDPLPNTTTLNETVEVSQALAKERQTKLFQDRYAIHNHAFVSLTSSITFISSTCSTSCLRFILVPLIVLGLVSAPSSLERNLCITIIEKFEEYFFTLPSPALSPASSETSGSSTSSVNPRDKIVIPWDELDAFSESVWKASDIDSDLINSASEWNWWDMLKHLKLDLVWPCFTSGSIAIERGPNAIGASLLTLGLAEGVFTTWKERGEGVDK